MKQTILFVDDDGFDRMAFERLVKQQKITCDYAIADSVQQAVRLIGSRHFDLVITDYFLGDGTALELFPMLEQTPVVLLTGAGDEELAVRAMKAGAYDYVTKDHECLYLQLLPQIVTRALMRTETVDARREHYLKLENVLQENCRQLACLERLSTAVAAVSTDAILVVDLQKRILRFNKAAEHMTGCAPEHLAGRPLDAVLRLVDERTMAALPQPIDRALQSGEPIRGTDHDLLLAVTGRRYPVAAVAAPVYDPDGNLACVVLALHDVSDHRKLEQLSANPIPSSSDRLLAPLDAIRAAAQMQADPAMPESTRSEVLASIAQHADRLHLWISQLAELATVESTASGLHREPNTLAHIVDEMVSLVRSHSPGVRFELNVATDPDLLQVDPMHLRSILTHLLDNAVRVTPPAGRVALQIAQRGPELSIQVADAGPGLAKEALPRLFDWFSCHDSPNQTSSGDLGLTIVKRIADLYNGRIEISSEPAHGTTITVYLPLHRRPFAA